MAGLTTASTNLTATLKTQAFSELQEGIFYNNEVFPLFERVPMMGGSTFNVKHHSAANSSITGYSEGDAVGTAGTETYTTSNWPVQYYKGVIQVTGHARDQLRNDSASATFFPQIANELTGLIKAAVDRASTDMLSTGTTAPVGLQGIVDSTGTLAGIAKSSNSWFASYEVDTAGSGLALTDLDIVYANSHDAEYAADIDLILTSWTQIRTAKGLGITFGSSNPYGLASTTGTVDLGQGFPAAGGMTYAGVPIVPVRDLTSTVWLFLTRGTIKIAVMRDWQVDPLGKTDDSDRFLLTGAYGLVCLNPRKNAKLTGA